MRCGPPRWPKKKTAPKDALLYIISPEDGATVKGAFWCRFGLRNMGVDLAGNDSPNAGHHHLLIDTNEPINSNEPIPHDKKHLHFGGGQTEALIDLPPGKHTLQLVLGDGNHFPFNPPLISKRITIMVESAGDSESISKQSKYRADHRARRVHSANVRAAPKQAEQAPKQAEQAPKNGGPGGCPAPGLLRLFKQCQEATSTPTKPPPSND